MAADLQYSSDLSFGRRSDSAITALVCPRSRPKPDDCSRLGPSRSDRFHRPSLLDPRSLAGSDRVIFGDEQLGRVQARAIPVTHGQTPETHWIRLSHLQFRPANRSLLAMRSMQPAF